MTMKSKGNILVKHIIITAIIIVCSTILQPCSIDATTSVWDGSVAENFAGGDGTESNPYQIENGEQLALLASEVNSNNQTFSNAYYILKNDIYLNDVNKWETWTDNSPKNIWNPIGINYMCPFSGNFNGNGYVVYGIFITKTTSYDKYYYNKQNIAITGLFGFVEKGVIRNLGVEKSCSIEKNYIQGGVVGQLNYGTIQNCYFNGIMQSSKGAYMGGIVGYNYGKIINCYTEGRIELIKESSIQANIGGIAGGNNGSIQDSNNKAMIVRYKKSGSSCMGGIVGNNYGEVLKCYNTGEIKSEKADSCGGIVGTSYEGKIADSYNNGKISIQEAGTSIGGVVGNIYKTSINNSYNFGNVSVGKKSKGVGGIAGDVSECKIDNCYNQGKITVNTGYDIGGLVGNSGDYNKSNLITNSYNTGNINTKDSSRIGGLVGTYDGTIKYCKNSGTIIAKGTSNSVGGILGLTNKTKVYNSFNTGNLNVSKGSGIGGIVGSMGYFFSLNEEFPNVKAGVYNCYNSGSVGGKGCASVGGIMGESYNSAYNCYNIGNVQGYYSVGPIVSGTTIVDNNPKNCYYLKGCVKLNGSRYKITANRLGTELTKQVVKSKSFVTMLNKWAQKDKKKYSTWKYSSKKNNGYPYLDWQY